MSDFFIDYTGRDYFSLVEKADAFIASILPEWTSRDDNDINWATIKTVAYLISIGMLYIDLGVNEQDPYEVQIRKNALRLARRYGMPVKKISGALVDLNVTLVTAPVTTTIISRGEEFSYTSYKYVLWDDLVFPIASTVQLGRAYFGSFERYQLGISDGTEYQHFLIDRDDVEDKKVRILINESGGDWETDEDGFVEWAAVETLVMSYETDIHYRLVLNENEKYEVYFGDNESGKIPANGAVLEVEIIKIINDYVDMNYGNLPAGNITVTTNPLIATVAQGCAAVGGAAAESVADIGRSLPQWLSTANRCVAPKDYEYLAKRVAGVQSSSASQVGVAVSLYVSPIGGGVATVALLSAVQEYILPRMFEDKLLSVLALSQVLINVTVGITVEDDYRQSIVKSLVEDALKIYLSSTNIEDNTVSLMHSYTAIDAVKGVPKATITELYRQGFSPSLGDVVLAVNETPMYGTVTVNAIGGLI